jgi:hypothetical protein
VGAGRERVKFNKLDFTEAKFKDGGLSLILRGAEFHFLEFHPLGISRPHDVSFQLSSEVSTFSEVYMTDANGLMSPR